MNQRHSVSGSIADSHAYSDIGNRLPMSMDLSRRRFASGRSVLTFDVSTASDCSHVICANVSSVPTSWRAHMLPVTARDSRDVSRTSGEKSLINLKFSISSRRKFESAARDSIDSILVELPTYR